MITGMGVCLAFASMSSVAAADAEDSNYDRTLQSVNIGLGNSGSIDSITDTRVSIGYGDEVEGETETTEYNPVEVVEDLPVRITPSYVTETSSGTDLSNLEGYTGRVEIFLSVQNLTLEPEDVSYDVAGESYSRIELIGTPLTVVGSTSVNIPVEQIVVSPSSQSATVTNGLLSQDEDGNAQLQWATILAPPQLPASTVFTVVADVEEFEVPKFDVTVQPGYVSDASTGEVLDQAFRSSLQSESDLILQTINVMADLDDLLAEAGVTVGQARSDLRVAAETVGTQTVQDLQRSIGSITSSTEQMISTLSTLEASVTSTLEASNSALLAQTSETISTVSSLLGDTQQAAPYVEFEGQACQARVVNQADPSSVFGSILNIDALMNGYADASQDCKVELQQMLEDALGPEIPNEETCQDSDGLTCQLEFSKSEIASTLERLEEEANEAVLAVEADKASDVVGSVALVNASISELATVLERLETEGEPSVIRQNIREIEQQLTNLDNGLDAIDRRYDRILELSDRTFDANSAIEEQRIELRNTICQMAPQPAPEPDPTDPADTLGQVDAMDPVDTVTPPVAETPLTEEEANELLRIVGSTDCYDQSFVQLRDTLESTIDEAESEISALKDFVAPTPVIDQEGNPILDDAGNPEMQYESTQALRDYVALARAELTSLGETYNADNAVLIEAVDDFREIHDRLVDEAETLTTQVTEINDDLVALEENMKTIFADAKVEMNEQLNEVIDSSVRQVETSKQASGDAVEQMFSILASEMNLNSAMLVEGGRESISSLQGELAALGDSMSARTEEQVREGIAAIDNSVSNATIDLEASNTLLTNDIQRVLSDIGVNSVESGGLLGTIANSAATTGLADEQVAQASSSTLEYANAQRGSLGRNAMANAQLRATAARSEVIDPFMIEPNPNVDYTIVYNFNVGGDK